MSAAVNWFCRDWLWELVSDCLSSLIYVPCPSFAFPPFVAWGETVVTDDFSPVVIVPIVIVPRIGTLVAIITISVTSMSITTTTTSSVTGRIASIAITIMSITTTTTFSVTGRIASIALIAIVITTVAAVVLPSSG